MSLYENVVFMKMGFQELLLTQIGHHIPFASIVFILWRHVF